MVGRNHDTRIGVVLPHRSRDLESAQQDARILPPVELLLIAEVFVSGAQPPAAQTAACERRLSESSLVERSKQSFTS